MQVKHNESN
jgi:hypothetical protein